LNNVLGASTVLLESQVECWAEFPVEKSLSGVPPLAAISTCGAPGNQSFIWLEAAAVQRQIVCHRSGEHKPHALLSNQ